VSTSETRQPIQVVQVSFLCDPERREPETLLRAWPTLPGVAAATARAGVLVTVVQAASRDQTIHRDGVRFEFVDDARAMPRRIAGRIPIVRRPARVLDRVTQLAPDVVHLHGLVLPFAARQLRETVHRTPLFVQDHASRAPEGLRRPLWRWAFGRFDAATFAAREQALPFVAAGTVRRAMPTYEVLEGSTCFMPGDRDEARRRTGLAGDPCILWTGHLDANKDPLVALDAFERAAASLPDARLWCCYGAAPLLEQVERRIADSKVLRDRVVLVGRRHYAEMEHYYRAADLFVQPSHREGCSYSTIEALACGVAPIVSDVPSMRRIVGEAGALVPVGDGSALAAAMIEWSARDPATRRAAARARFESALTFDVIGRELLGVYETLLAQR
jgi:glycosyltransferase involved in cell wall biosynthesis